MKKALLILVTIAALALLAVYIFIPAKLKVEAIANARANDVAAHRVLMDEANWTKWWPYEKSFHLDGTRFEISKKMLNAFEIMIYKNNDSLSSVLKLIPSNYDSLQLEWKTELMSDNNPFNRIAQYTKSVSLKKDMNIILDSLKTFLSKKENIYGFDVKQVKVVDSVLISSRKSFDHYPNEFEIEEMIKRLRIYINANQAKEMNYPMLHVQQTDTGHFEAMIAIATDIELPDTKDFAHKMLLKGGNLLEGEIRGGYATIRRAFQEYEYYLEDNGYTSPAIPYELLITDRIKEPDTTKWVTKVCYPVF